MICVVSFHCSIKSTSKCSWFYFHDLIYVDDVTSIKCMFLHKTRRIRAVQPIHTILISFIKTQNASKNKTPLANLIFIVFNEPTSQI